MKKNEIIALKVKKRVYFCTVKDFKIIIRASLLTFISLISNGIPAMATQNQANQMDSVEISLLTCSPHEQVYSLYGHSALRYKDLRTGEDFAFNWGIFNFKKPFFVLRFMFGLTDYELGIMPIGRFCEEYKRRGSQVMEQVLNLTADEKRKVRMALAENLRPENRVYRYNFLYDNCSTRPRNIIENSLNGEIQYQVRQGYTPTYREMVREHTRNHPWATAGNDLLLGVKADLPTDLWQQEFLPQNLMYDFDHAQIYEEGTYRPLVKERRIIVKGGVQVIKQDFPLSPTECAVILLIISLLIMSVEFKKKHTYKGWDVALMAIQGSTGTILFLMFFSQHPTTSTNLQILLLNPLPLAFLYHIIKKKKSVYWKLSAIMTTAFFIGGFFQDYAEGMEIVALSLLTRNISHFKNEE